MDVPRYVIEEIDEAIAAGDLEPRTGEGKPIPNLTRDPHWWVRSFLNRERYADGLADVRAHRDHTIGEAVATEQLGVAREMVVRLNDGIESWNDKAPPDCVVDLVSEIWLITERAKAPGH